MSTAPLRVASLLPAATEIVCALGQGDALVGVSHECDHPPEVRSLPVLTSSKVKPSPSSAAVDRGVREIVRTALGVYDVDLAALARADPDLIVTQDLCDVCAVALGDVERAVREVLRPGVGIVSLRPLRLADVWDDVRRVASALGVRERGERLAGRMAGQAAEIGERARALAGRPRVLTIEWIDPVMIGGTWMPELVELAGGRALVTRPGDRAPTLAEPELAALEPDVVVVKPCGFDLERTREEEGVLRALMRRMPWPAVRSGSVYIADGNAFFNRPGPRLVESLEILAACVHPEEFADFADRHAASFERWVG